MAYRFKLNNKVIWDNTDFENIISNQLSDPSNYLPVKPVNNQVVSIGGWRIDIQSVIHSTASSEDVISGYNILGKRLNLDIKRIFLPFFTFDITNFTPDIKRQKAKAVEEPMIAMFLRLCYWYHKCDHKSTLQKKKKEIRDKLKVSNDLVKLIRTRGLYDSKVREWLRQSVGVIYELMSAALADMHAKRISFEKNHDFIYENLPAEVKTIFPPTDPGYRDEFYPFLNNKLKDSSINLKHVMQEFITIPKIMDNNIKKAIEKQKGEIVFLNIILKNLSSALTFLSEYKHLDLSLKSSLEEADNLLNSKTVIPVVISFHAIRCKYELFALTLPVSVFHHNGQRI